MAYTEIEQITLDIDLYLKDNKKNIHIASGGGRIPNSLANTDIAIEDFKDRVGTLDESFEIEINSNLSNLLNLTGDGSLENYLEDFRKKARQGFYTYDKTNLGNFEDFKFHLVAKPINKKKDTLNIDDSNLLKIKRDLPEEFEPFNLDEYIPD